MSIAILNTHFVNDPDTGQPIARHADIVITSGADNYLWGVGGLPEVGDLQTILEAREAELLVAVIAAGVESNAPEIAERLDLAGLEDDIVGELAWILTARTDITAGIATLDSGATLAQTRAVVKGLAQIVDRMLLEQQRELKAWRYVVRRVG